MKNEYIYAIVGAVVIGGVAFFGGMEFQKSRTEAQFVTFRNGSSGGNGMFIQRGANGSNGGMRQGRMQIGEVVSANDTSMTVKYPDGSSKIIVIPSSATISKASEGSKSDLQSGTKVLVMGTTNSDGTMTAQNIQIDPPLQAFYGNRPNPSTQPNQ